MKNKVKRQPSIATRAIHGNKLYAFRGPVATPIYQTSTYRFESSKDAVRYAKGDPSIYVYSRYHNPTVHDVEEKLTLMENSESATMFSSGMAAITTAILAATKSGDNIISTTALYGGTYRWMRDELPRRNIVVRNVNPNQLEYIARIADKRTSLVYFETPTNPTLDIVDIKELVRQTRKTEKILGRRILTIIDNTFATIINQNPFQFGVDVIIESATKYLGGHSDILAGIVLGKKEFIKKVKALGKYHGGCADPFAAYLLGRSLKTFELRIKRQNENAMALAYALEKHKKVKRVIYPGLPSHPQHHIAEKQMNGFGGIVTLEVRPSKRYLPIEASVKVCDNLGIAVNAMSLGSVETLVSIPVYSSHVFMSDEELKCHGVNAGMIRISVGIEGIQDLIEDFQQALSMI